MLKKIYSFINETSYSSLPSASIEMAKLAYLDTIASSISGIDSKEIDILLKGLIKDEGLSYKEAVNALSDKEFALFIGTLSHVLDYDDVNFTFHGHPSVALIPIILTYSKFNRLLEGKELILSYLIGFEVQARLGEDIGNAQYQKGLHTTSTLGIFGAASVITKLKNLSYDEFANLFGMCISFSSGVRKNFGTMTKPLHTGMLAHNVYLFSELVERGFTGNKEPFTNPMSYASITTSVDNSLSSLSKLGETWESEEFGIIIKKYPCCAFTHRSIDAIIHLKEEHQFTASEIENIVAKVNPKVESVLIYPEATTGAEGKFSMQYCLSAALIDGQITLQTFEQSTVDRADIRSLMPKVSMITDTEQIGLNKERVAEVIVTLLDGQVLTAKVENPLGHPFNPLTKEMLRDKVEDCSKSFLSSSEQESLIEVCNNLEDYTGNDLLRIFI